MSASTATGMRMAAVRLRLRSHHPFIRNSATAAAVRTICLYMSSGVEVAATLMPSDVR